MSALEEAQRNFEQQRQWMEELTKTADAARAQYQEWIHFIDERHKPSKEILAFMEGIKPPAALLASLQWARPALPEWIELTAPSKNSFDAMRKEMDRSIEALQSTSYLPEIPAYLHRRDPVPDHAVVSEPKKQRYLDSPTPKRRIGLTAKH